MHACERTRSYGAPSRAGGPASRRRWRSRCLRTGEKASGSRRYEEAGSKYSGSGGRHWAAAAGAQQRRQAWMAAAAAAAAAQRGPWDGRTPGPPSSGRTATPIKSTATPISSGLTDESVPPPARDLHFKVVEWAVGGDGVVGAHRRRVAVVRARANVLDLRMAGRAGRGAGRGREGLGRELQQRNGAGPRHGRSLPPARTGKRSAGMPQPPQAPPACRPPPGSAAPASGCCHPTPTAWAAAAPTSRPAGRVPAGGSGGRGGGGGGSSELGAATLPWTWSHGMWLARRQGLARRPGAAHTSLLLLRSCRSAPGRCAASCSNWWLGDQALEMAQARQGQRNGEPAQALSPGQRSAVRLLSVRDARVS